MDSNHDIRGGVRLEAMTLAFGRRPTVPDRFRDDPGNAGEAVADGRGKAGHLVRNLGANEN